MALLTLYGRSWCHLCDDMHQALLPLQADLGFELECWDVDSDPELEARFDELVPVLTARPAAGQGEEVELCHYHLDEAAVRSYCAG